MAKYRKIIQPKGSRAIKSSAQTSRKAVTAAESYGWVVDDNEAWDAYEFACEYLGKDYVDDAIINTLSTEDIASSLAYLFRMWDFREWENRFEDEESSEGDE